jgi:3-oxoacyl-[acyl-carrier-protein] synthase-3
MPFKDAILNLQRETQDNYMLMLLTLRYNKIFWIKTQSLNRKAMRIPSAHTPRHSKITGTGSYLPNKILSNRDLENKVDTSDAWIVERTGIRFRHIAEENETVVDMALAAIQRALTASGKKASELDLIITATCTVESHFPSVATRLQHRLGIKNIPSFDINAACTGFIYALHLADIFIRSGQYCCIAIVCAERMSSLIDWKDRSTCILFGDGAGAMVLERSTSPGIRSCHIYADGQYGDLLYHDPVRNAVIMDGNKVFKIAVKTLGRIIDETLASHNMQHSDIDWLIPHQANLRIIQAVAQNSNVPNDRVIITIDQHANTSSASIPLALDSAIRSNRIQHGETILLVAFGAGFTWGSALLSI